jgi:hypothetical protein
MLHYYTYFPPAVYGLLLSHHLGHFKAAVFPLLTFAAVFPLLTFAAVFPLLTFAAV